MASRDDPYIRFERARLLAQFWGSRFADAGQVGHINAASVLGEWHFGQFLLTRFTARAGPQDKPEESVRWIDISGPGLRRSTVFDA